MAIMKAIQNLVQFLFILVGIIPLSESVKCPALNSVYPAPRNLSNSEIITQASASLQQTLDAILASNTTGTATPLDTLTTSFSVDVFSLHTQRSLFNFHFSAPVTANATDGVRTVDQDTVYRIGSISKLLTVYTYLIAAGDRSWNDPVTEYIPELAEFSASYNDDDEVDVVDWESVTVGDLASQLAGIGRDNGGSMQRDLALQAFGLPPVPSVNISWCGTPLQLEFPCDREGFFDWFSGRHPVTVPGNAPVYSNVAFQILAYVLESITGSPFSETFQTELVDALSLNSTFYDVPPTPDTSIIPINISAAFWDYSLADESPAGNYYMSIADMQRIGRSILNNTFLTKSQTKRWLKPHSFVPSTREARQAVGAPFEMSEFSFVQRESVDASSETAKAPIWLYTKGGDIGAYSTVFVLLPEYDAAFTVFAAGLDPSTSKSIVSDLVSNTFIPALDAAGREEALSNYGGTYVNEATNSTLVVSTTPVGDGLLIEDWITNGTSVNSLMASFLIPPSQQGDAQVVSYMFPTGLTNQNGTRTSWRLAYEISATGTSDIVLPDGVDATDPALSGPNVFSGACSTWGTFDALVYGGNSLDEIIFELGANGRATSLVTRGTGEHLGRAAEL